MTQCHKASGWLNRRVSYPEEFAESYDRWAADMTEDVPFYVELAKEADGPVVELAVGTGRVAIPVAQAIGRKVIGIDSSPAMLAQAREAGGDTPRPQARRHARARARGAGGARLLPVPGAPPPADVEPTGDASSSGSRPRFARAGGSPGTRSPSIMRSRRAWTDCAQEEPLPHTLRYAVGESRIDIVLDSGDTSSLWWATKNEWLGLLDVVGPRDGGALRLVRPAAVRRREPRVRLGRAQARGMTLYDRIARIYDPWSRSVTEDVGFYVERALASGGPVVELAVGTGRIAVPIAEAGVHVIGVDSSPEMLAVARQTAEAAGVAHRLDLRLGDLREPPVKERVPLVICPFRSLLHMETEAEKLRALDAARELLEPGGTYVFDVFAPSREDIDGDARPLARARARDLRARRLGRGRSHALAVGALGRGRRRDVRRSTGCLRPSGCGLLDGAGFEVEALYGWFDGRPLRRRGGHDLRLPAALSGIRPAGLRSGAPPRGRSRRRSRPRHPRRRAPASRDGRRAARADPVRS